MDHLLDSFFIVFAQIDNSGEGFRELSATGTVEESAPRTDNCSVDEPFSVIASNPQIRVLSSEM